MLLFVYGTLKKGYVMHKALLNREPLCEATTERSWLMLACGYPAILDTPMGRKALIKGEVYSITPQEMANICKYEGVAYLPKRVKVTTTASKKSKKITVTAFFGRPEIFLYDNRFKPVPSGKFEGIEDDENR